MKELTSYNRVAGYLNKIFDLLNSRFFESELSRPTITIQSTPKAYGHFSLRDDTWISKNGCSHEINIGAGTLARPIESVCATLLHEMVNYRTYSDRIRLHIVPALGRLKLQALNAPTVQRFINWMKDGDKETAPPSPKTVKSVHGVLHKALQQALILGYIKTNPADHCTLPQIVRKQFKPLDENSTVPFLDAIRGDRYENLFVVDLFTGLRFGEILGLKWENIDFRTGIITVTQQLQHEKKSGGTNYLTSLKNNKTRQIRVAETVLQALREEQKQQLLFRMAAGRDWAEPIPGLVFTGDRGAPISQSAVRRHFKSIAERIGLPDLRFHDLRHSFAVASLQNGDDIKTVQENLGHHSASFTLDVYGHVTDKMRQDSAERMENYIKALRG